MKIIILNPYFESLGGGEKVVSVMAEYLAKNNDITILVKSPIDKKTVENYFNVNLQDVNFKLLPKNNLFIRAITSGYSKFPGRWKSIIYDRVSLKSLQKLKPELFINNLYQSSLPSPVPKSIYMCMFPQKLDPAINANHTLVRKVYNQLTNHLENWLVGSRRQAINSYSQVVANSKYTADWIKKYWRCDSVVLYPVCDNMGPPSAKQKIIVTAGRFFADNGSSHHKRHDELIKAFIRLGRSDWELHVAGSLNSKDQEALSYFKGLEQMAEGHPNIFLHPNIPFAGLKDLYRKATIYWHATGFGYDSTFFPENQEHFGMVTVEAMSAGAVPVVYNSAGQKEVVSNGEDGYLWDTIDDLLKYSEQLMDNAQLYRKLQEAAMKRSLVFDRQSFLKQVDHIISSLNN